MLTETPKPAPFSWLTPSLRHFITLARRGAHPACSSGERQAHLLARAIEKNTLGLDLNALAGANEFIGIAEHNPQTARRLLDPKVKLPSPE